jgi:hypothetical protein
METVKVQCPAKINLDLKVINRRDDGFHNIESIMQTISLYDYLTINVESSNENSINLSGSSDEIPYDERNLVYKAAKLFLDEVNIDPVKISIYIDRKHIVLYEYNALWERGDLYISIIYRNDQKPCFFALMRTFLHNKVLYKYNKYIILMYILRMI